jgi:hypothetical protein
MRHDNAVSSTAHNLQGSSGTLLEVLLEGTREGSGAEDFLAELARLAAAELSRPGRQVSCGITLERRKRASIQTGSTGEGAASPLRIPLALGGDSSAVVNFYAPRTQPFSSDDSEKAHEFAAAASPALLLALEISQLSQSRADLAAAMQARTIIDIAIGVIMAQNRCGREAAFKIIRNTSNNRNMKIRDVAAALVSSIAGDTDHTAHFQE